MVRSFYILFFTLAGSLLVGCENQPEKPLWQQVKLSDLAPAEGTAPPDFSFDAVNIDIYLFEFPAENLKTFDALWPVLSNNPFDFQNYQSLKNNSINAGFGEGRTWNKLADSLQKAQARMTQKTSLLLTEQGGNFAPLAVVEVPRTIYYVDRHSSVRELKIPSGNLYLYCKADKIPGSRGVVKLEVVPVFSRSEEPDKPGKNLLLSNTRSFSHLSLKLEKISPAQFIVLAPNKKLKGDLTLSSLIFSDESMIGHRLKLFAIVCTAIRG